MRLSNEFKTDIVLVPSPTFIDSTWSCQRLRKACSSSCRLGGCIHVAPLGKYMCKSVHHSRHGCKNGHGVKLLVWQLLRSIFDSYSCSIIVAKRVKRMIEGETQGKAQKVYTFSSAEMSFSLIANHRMVVCNVCMHVCDFRFSLSFPCSYVLAR